MPIANIYSILNTDNPIYAGMADAILGRDNYNQDIGELNRRQIRAREGQRVVNIARQTQATEIKEQKERMEVDGVTKVQLTMKLIQLAARMINPNFDYNKCRGTFAYTSIKKYQNYRLDITNYSDAILSAAILTRRDLIDPVKLPVTYKKMYDIAVHADLDSDDFNMQFYSKFKRWITMKERHGFTGEYKYITQRDGRTTAVINPITNRKIKVNQRAYKNIFGKIPLMSKIDNKYDDLCLYKTEDYEVNEYCVPSYLQKKLKVKEYKKINDDLIKNPSPTYIQLTEILKNIDYGLDVYITDGECIQREDKYDKYISIMIHVDHMYVLKTNNRNIIKKDKDLKKEILNVDDFERLTGGEMYTSGSKTINGIKYKCDNHYRKIEDRFNLMSSFSQNNIDFFNGCGIRPVRYFMMERKNVQGLDINKCYPNILKHNKYVFPIQNGTEKTEVYDNKEIKSHGFYYIDIKDRTDIEIAIFGKDGYFWILGYLIVEMKLKKRCTIKYQHIANDYKYFISNKDYYGSDKIKCEVLDDNMGLTLYSGYLAKYEYDKTKYLVCDGLEKDAYLAKYENDGGCATKGYIAFIEKREKNGKIKEVYRSKMYKDSEDRQQLLNKIKSLNYEIDYETKPNVCISSTYYKKSCGLYAYLAILQYARLQIWHIYNEVKKISTDANIKKIYTDSITFDVPITDEQKNKINERLEKHGFTVKLERSIYEWNNTPIIIQEPEIYTTELIDNNDINKLLNEDRSFCIDSLAGYGKSHLIKNKIIPYINEHNKKYILTTTTDESQKIYKDFECNTLQSVLSSKDTTLFTLNKKFKDVDYLIIDECSYIQMHLLNILQYLKKVNSNLKIILAGDVNQCTFGLNLMKTDVFYDLVDGNVHTIEYHSNCRYNKDYDKFLKGLLTFKGGYDSKCMDYVKKYFNKQIKKDGDKDDNEIKLTWTHAKGKKLSNYMTVHSVQGQTLSKYSIYETDRMDVSILYTALSRARDPKLITIFL